MPGRPAKILLTHSLPPPVLSEPSLRSDEMKVWPHAAGRGLAQPHPRFVRIFRCVSPPDHASRVRGSNVRSNFSVEHCIAHTPLQAASPHRRLIIRATLVVPLEPHCDLSDPIEIRSAAHVAARVREEEAVRFLLFRNPIVLLPDFEYAVVECPPVCRSSRRRQLAADLTMTLRQTA